MPNGNKMATHHPIGCVTCGHRDMHSTITGCTHVLDASRNSWCPCETYVQPDTRSARQKAQDTAQGVSLGEQGAQAALDSNATTMALWRPKAREVLDDLVKSGRTFTSDDVVDKAGVAPSPSAIGGLFMTAARDGRIRAVGFVTSTRVEAHGRPIRQWQGATT